MRIVEDLIADKLVIPTGAMQASGGGRRREMLQFHDSGYVVIGVDLGGTKMYGAVTTLGGDILYEKNIAAHGSSGEAAYKRLVDLLDALIGAVPPNTAIRGIGIGAPGITSHKQGIVRWAPSLNWRDFPLLDRLAGHYDYPVIVDNDVNLAALGELWFGIEETVKDMVLVTIGTGIGAGIIVDGTLYRGAWEASGEIGHFLLGRQFLGKRYDTFGALEDVASGRGIAERGRAAYSGSSNVATNLMAEDVISAAQAGEDWAKHLLEEAVDYLTMCIANISVLLDPEIIVIGGGVAQAAEILIDPIRERMEGTIPHRPDIRLSKLGTRAAVMGTIARVLQHTAEYYVIRNLS